MTTIVYDYLDRKEYDGVYIYKLELDVHGLERLVREGRIDELDPDVYHQIFQAVRKSSPSWPNATMEGQLIETLSRIGTSRPCRVVLR